MTQPQLPLKSNHSVMHHLLFLVSVLCNKTIKLSKEGLLGVAQV